MAYKFSQRSLDNLHGIHPDLIAVAHRALAISPTDFVVIDGMRELAEQRHYVAQGKSKTMNSRHLTGHAMDLVPWVDGDVSWDWDDYYPLATAVKQAAQDVGVNVEWGGDWKRFKDGPHWQLPWAEYAKDDMRPRHSGTDDGRQINLTEHYQSLISARDILNAQIAAVETIL